MGIYKKGDRFPDLCFQTAYRTDLKVKDILKGRTVFWVLRYIGCPVCHLDITMIAERYEEFQKKNAQVYVVMQSDPEHVRASLGEAGIPFDIICDTDMKFYDELHVAPAESMEALAGKNKALLEEKGAKAEAYGFVHGDYEGDEQQLPALFIVEEDGTISFAHYASDLMDMPEIDDVLNLL